MEPTSVAMFAILGILLARAVLPRRFAWPLAWLALAVVGWFVFADTPTIAFGLKLALFVALAGFGAWRWRREHASATESA